MEQKQKRGYAISYFAAVVILLGLYVAKQTPVALIGSLLCAGLGVKNWLDYQNMKKRDQEDDAAK